MPGATDTSGPTGPPDMTRQREIMAKIIRLHGNLAEVDQLVAHLESRRQTIRHGIDYLKDRLEELKAMKLG